MGKIGAGDPVMTVLPDGAPSLWMAVAVSAGDTRRRPAGVIDPVLSTERALTVAAAAG
jgi:hypothetical protein